MQAVTNSVLPSASPKASVRCADLLSGLAASLRKLQGSEALSLGRPDSHLAGTSTRRGIQISGHVGLHPVVAHHVRELDRVGNSVVGPNVVPHDLPAERDVQIFLIGRKRNAVRECTSGLRVPKLLIKERDLAIFHEVEPTERQLSLRTRGGAAQARDTVREIDRAVGFDNQVVRSAETLALETVGQHSASPILLYSRDIAVGHRTDDHSPLRVTRQPVRADEKGGGPAAARLLTDIRKVGARVPGIFQENRNGPVRLPPVDDVVQHVAEQQIAVLSLLNPDSSFG